MKTALSALLLFTSMACGSVTSSSDAGSDAFEEPNPDSGTAPSLTSVDPPSGIVTTEVTLTGTAFGAAEGTVTVDGVTATVFSWSDTQILLAIPDVMPGPADIEITPATGPFLTAYEAFRVILPPSVYVHNAANDPTSTFDTVTVLTYVPETGRLTEMGAPVSIGAAASGFGGCSSSLKVHEGTRRLFVTAGGSIGVFDIDPVSGALTAVAGSPFAAGGTRLFGIEVNAAGTRLFAGEWNAAVVVMDIDGAGALTAVTGSPFASGTPDTDIPMLSRNESFLYVNTESAVFGGYAVGAAGGLTALTGSPFASSNSFGADTRPGHDQLYIPDSGGAIRAWNLDPTTGAPTEIAGSPFAATAPAGYPHFPAFTADGGRMYVSAYSSGYLFGFDVDDAGVPTPLTGSPWDTALAQGISCMAVSADGRHLVALHEGAKQVAVFGLAGDGVPAQVTGSPFTQTTPAEDASGLAITF